MRTGKKQLIGCLLALCMFFAGMCPEQAQAHSFFVCADSEPAAWIARPDAGPEEMDVCTVEMLGIRNTGMSYGRRTALPGGFRRTSGLFLSRVPACGADAPVFFYRGPVRAERFPKLRQPAAVLHYIHSKDGKK